MPDYKDRIYQSYRSTTSNNQYRAANKTLPKAARFQFESQWGRFLPKNKKAPILDAACGGGEFLLFLQEKGYTALTGTDLSPQQVEAATAAGLGNIVQTDALSYLAVNKGQFAVICAFSFLEHLTRDELFQHLDAIRAALKPGGVLLGHVPNAKGPFGAFVRYADITHELSFTPESILQVASTVDLVPVFIGESGPLPHGPVSLARWAVWQVIRGLYLTARVVQAADYHYRVYTQDLRFVLRKDA